MADERAEGAAGSKILIVDDEPFNVDYLQQELDDLGYETVTASNGREALEKVAVDPPDLILLDVIMPEIDGITVCRMLKDDPTTRLIPIVIMTALDATEDRVRGIEAGADDFLTKPVDDRELIARINTALQAKAAVDVTVEELRSASEQLERLGSQEVDLSVLAVDVGVPGDRARDVTEEVVAHLITRYVTLFSTRVETFDGEVLSASDGRLTAVFRSPKPETHTRHAFDAALSLLAEADALNRGNRVQPLEVSVGVGSGKVSLGSIRIESTGGARWQLQVQGSALDSARSYAAVAETGQVVTDAATVGRVGDRYVVEKPATGTSVAAAGLTLVRTGRPELRPARSEPADIGLIEAEADSSTEPAVAEEPVSDIGPQGLPWPAEYDDLQASLWDDWAISSLYLHRVLSGKSGAFVFAVDIATRDFEGQAILKLDEVGDLEWDEEDEATRHLGALEANPGYAAEHLPVIVHALKRGEKLAVLSTIAARGLEYSLPWSHCDFDAQMSSTRSLSRELLEEWNTEYRLADGMVAPGRLLAGWLDYRLDPDAGGRIHGFLSDECGLDPAVPTFLFEGHWYPNPLAFATGVQELPETLNIRALVGNTHGDLHGYNVLVTSVDSGAVAYYVIDLAFYEPRGFLLFDHAYFEVSHLLEMRAGAPYTRWLHLVDALTRDVTATTDDLGLVQLAVAARDEVAAWVERYEPNRLSYLDSQFMLARVGAGLSFSHKRLSLEGRRRAFLYAAANLKQYVKFHGLEWPKHGDVLVLD